MVAREFTELVCWQLATELKVQVYAIIARPKVTPDFKFCNQIRESVRSAPRNIAEGFGKYDPPEFRRYLGIAAGSLKESQNHLRDALTQGYVKSDEFSDLWLLASRARKATLGLMAYLESCPRKWKRPASHPTKVSSGRTRPKNPTQEPDGAT